MKPRATPAQKQGFLAPHRALRKSSFVSLREVNADMISTWLWKTIQMLMMMMNIITHTPTQASHP